MPMLLSDRRARGAFTLIEIMCVLVILTIAAAMVVAGMGNSGDLQSESSARTLLADLTFAQNRAIATQSPVYVTFNTTAATVNGIPAHTYALCSALPSTYLTNPVSQQNYTNSWNGSNWSISTVTLGGQNAMYFDQLGTPWSITTSGGGAAILSTNGSLVVSSGGKSVTINIQPDTGDMTFQ